MPSEGTSETVASEDAGHGTVPRRSRRAIIGGGLAAAGAGIAGSLLATASPAAADGTALLTGEANTATNTTSLSNTTGTCFQASSSSGQQPVLSAFDESTGGSQGASAALYGQSSISAGVVGYSVNNSGVVGVGTGSGASGVFGQGTSADGVYGQLDPASTTYGIAAVFGFDTTAAPGNIGVFGESFSGIAVSGVAGVNGEVNANGVAGQTYGDGGYGVGGFDSSPDGGLGVWAATQNGVALRADVSQENGGGTGFALAVNGPSQFVTGGTAVVPAGKSSVTVAVDYVTPSSFVLATLQGAPTAHLVESAVAGNGTVTIYLNLPVAVARTVGFLALVPNSVTPPAARRRPAIPALGRLARRRAVAVPKPLKP
jgi:hypothetical protein